MISQFTAIEGRSKEFYLLLMGMGFLVFLGAISFFTVEHFGHGVTNMNNQIAWGLPHVVAIALLVMASGALNLASMSTVFGAKHYTQFRRFSAFLSIALLVGGLAVLVLDLGRPDRMLLVVMHMNFRSMFTWNVFLYSGFVIFCFLYLWAMMEHDRFTKIAGSTAFAWRLILTTGTGSIFGVIHAREVFHSAITAPTFIAVSLSSGTAICIILLTLTYQMTGRELEMKLLHGLRNMLIFFTLLVAYLLVVEKFTQLYSPAYQEVEGWVLTGPYGFLYWGGVVVVGIVAPLAILFMPGAGSNVKGILTASLLSILGEISFIAYVLIAGQSYPLNMFPGYEMSSVFLDGQTGSYTPGVLELMLGIGGVGITGLIYLLGIRFFRLLPQKAVAPESWHPWNP